MYKCMGYSARHKARNKALDDFHSLWVFIEIHKIMFYLVRKHLRHCIGLTKVLEWKPLTVGQVFCLHCHCNPHRCRFTTTCFNHGLENKT